MFWDLRIKPESNLTRLLKCCDTLPGAATQILRLF